MAEHHMTLMDRQRIARDTMAFWFDTNGARYEFRARQHADFIFGSESDNSRTFSIASSPVDKEPIMIAMRMRKTAFKTASKAAALGTGSSSAVHGGPSRSIEISPGRRCFLRAASGLPR